MADEQPESGKTAKDVITEKIIRLGLEVDTQSMNKNFDPVLSALGRKLKDLEKASNLQHGLFGKDFIKDKMKSLTGLDGSLLSSVQNMMKYGIASKELGADNKEFYNSLNLVGKALINVADFFKKKKQADKEASEQAQKTANQLAEADEQAMRMEGMNKMLQDSDVLSAGLEGLGPEAEAAAKAVECITPAVEGATSAMAVLGSVATLGLGLLVAGAIEATKIIYQMVMQAVTARAEFKKFDQMFGGLSRSGVTEGIRQLGTLNKAVWGLGLSLEKVNEVVFNATAAGLSFNRAIDTQIVSSVLELSGATGVAASEIGELFTTLMKTTKISNNSLQEMGDSFIAVNRSIKATGVLGQVSFSTFKDGIMSSANALGIAASKGESFTNKMSKDLLNLSTLASNLSLSISDLNAKFEEASDLISSGDSGFRTLLALSGGANINQMLSNEFNKTDAMIKNIQYLQNLNKSFGGMTNVTAQVAAQSLGISKDVAIKLINTRQETITAMKQLQEETAGMQTGAMKDAWEKVNSGIMDQWSRVKTMFTTFFQNAFGASTGMNAFVAKLENFIATLRNNIEKGGWLDKLTTVVDKVADWIGGKLTDILNWIENELKDLMNPNTSIIAKLVEYLMKVLMAPMWVMGKLLGAGFRAALGDGFYTNLLFGEAESQEQMLAKLGGGTNSNPMTNQLNNPWQDNLSANKSREDEITAEMARNNKYAPDQVTYGTDSNGNVGFMTIAQKQFVLEEEKKKLQEKDRITQQAIAANTAQIAKNTMPRGQSTSFSSPTPFSPVGLPGDGHPATD